jgi:murein tripeptide amidase MpaA
MAYLSVTEVNSAIQGLAGAFPTLCTLINLPNNSVLGKQNLALRIGEPNSPKSKGVLFTGCTHAREWAGAEICIFFASDILTAFRDGHGVGYGSKTFTRNQIRQILETVDLFIFPCVNPDGREFSMANDSVGGPNGWRKNRRPLAGGQVGIDLNRNYDFLWDFPTKFAASAINLNLASANPADLTYHGTAPATEPEIQNVIWLLDNFPQIRFYMDIHNFVVPGDLLFNWGDAPNQSANSAMMFTNPAFDGHRGVNNVAQYGEFITPDDLLTVRALAQRTGAAIAPRAVTPTCPSRLLISMPPRAHRTITPPAGASSMPRKGGCTAPVDGAGLGAENRGRHRGLARSRLRAQAGF